MFADASLLSQLLNTCSSYCGGCCCYCRCSTVLQLLYGGPAVRLLLCGYYCATIAAALSWPLWSCVAKHCISGGRRGPAVVVRPHALAAETALYTQPISAVGGLHRAEGVETACHAEGAEHVCHAFMHACVCVRVGSPARPTAANAPSDPTKLWCDYTCARRDVAGMGTRGCL